MISENLAAVVAVIGVFLGVLLGFWIGRNS